MRRLVLLAAVSAAAFAPAAGAGGWATVQLSAVPADGIEAGTTLPIDITVLQHGRTPLQGVTPVFRVRDGDGNVLASYKGTATGRTGVYHVDVQFPTAEVVRYEVYDGFESYGGAKTHTYAPVQVGAPGGGDSFPFLTVAVGALLGLALLGGAAFLVLRPGRPAEPARVA